MSVSSVIFSVETTEPQVNRLNYRDHFLYVFNDKVLFVIYKKTVTFTGLSLLAITISSCSAEPKGDTTNPLPAGFREAVDIRATPLKTKSIDAYSRIPFTVEFRTKLPFVKMAQFHLLASNAPGYGSRHWEIYTTPLHGYLTAKVSGVAPDTLQSFVRITDDKWHYVALTCSNEQMALYLDGKQVAVKKVRPLKAKPKAGGELFVGFESNYEVEKTSVSLIDELRISNVVREINDVPNKPFEVDKQTIGLWHFDKESSEHRDLSNNSNQLAHSPAIDSDWTPHSSTRADAEPWERETDYDWHDGRFDKMDKGQCLGVTMKTARAMKNAHAPYVPKGLAIRVGDEHHATVLFDRAMLQMSAAWTDGFVRIPARRFGLIDHPEVVGELVFSSPSQPGCDKPNNASPRDKSSLAPLPADWARFNGLYLHDDQTILSYQLGNSQILELPWTERTRDLTAITRTFELAPSTESLRVFLAEGKKGTTSDLHETSLISFDDATPVHIAVGQQDGLNLELVKNRAILNIEPHEKSILVKVFFVRAPRSAKKSIPALVKTRPAKVPPSNLIRAGQPRWQENITTVGKLGTPQDGSPLALDTITLPYSNPHNSIFYVTGVGFLPDGRMAISTIYGDVWIVSGVDESLGKLQWKRFATGLYQPMGLVIKDEKIHVLERGQITCLHDLNGDDEADFYENIYNGWETPGAGHAYDTALNLAPDGSFYFFKGQAGKIGRECGCLLRVAADGKSHEIYSSGFRHPIGLGISPDGVVTGGDQQGNWIPATRIDQFKKGGFYGDMRTHHRKTAPKSFDKPICWLPRYVDNSAGGQVTLPVDATWGSLAGQTLHFSWGRCTTFLLMREEVEGQVQGGVVQLPLDKFIGGPLTGTYNDKDAHIYVAGLDGWQTAATKDGCLQRIRYTGEKLASPIAIQANSEGLDIRFSTRLDEGSIKVPKCFSVEQWNYRYAETYGSDHWSVAHPDQQGHDVVQVESVTLAEDGQTVRLKIPSIQPVMQMRVDYDIQSASGKKLAGTIHNTINAIGMP